MRHSRIEAALTKMNAGDSTGADELQEIASCSSYGMGSAVAASFLYLNGRLDLSKFHCLAVFAQYAVLMLCERKRDPIARSYAEQLLTSGNPWQLRIKALWYLVTLDGNANLHVDKIDRLRREFDDGIDYLCTGHVPDMSFIDPIMAELQLLGLEALAQAS